MKKWSALLLSFVLVGVLVFDPFGASIYEIPKYSFVLIVLGVVLGMKAVWGGKICFNKWVFVFLGMWGLSLLLSTVFSVAPELSFWGSYDRVMGLYSHLVVLVFFILFLDVEIEVFLKVLIGVGVVSALFAVGQKFFGGVPEFVGRSYGLMGHPNFLGQFLIFPIWASVYFLTKQKWIFVLILGILLLGLLCTGNRASILGVMIGMLFFLRNRWIVLGLGGGMVLLFIYLPEMRSMLSRMHLWEGALRVFWDNPLIGAGLESFEIVFQKYVNVELLGLEHFYAIADRAHNEYLDILAMQGALGLIVYLAAMISVFVLGRSRVFLAGLVSILVSSFFSFGLIIQYVVLAGWIALILKDVLVFKKIKIPYGVLIILAVLNIWIGVDSLYSNRDVMERNVFQKDVYYYYGEKIEEAGKFSNYDFRYYLAIGEYGRAYELAANNPVVLKEWGNKLFEEKDYVGAVDKYEKYMDLLPEDWNNRLFLKHVPDFKEIKGRLNYSKIKVEPLPEFL